MRKIILILLLMSFIASCNAETSINKNLYNLLSVQESIVKTKIRDINSNILEKAINIIDRDVKNINSVDKVTMYTFLKNVFEKELQERGNYAITTNQNNMENKIKITTGSNELIAEIDNTTIAKDFMSLLPITTDLSDYNNTEKIFYSPRKLDTAGASLGFNPDVGDIAYYSPWGNIVIYYKDFGYSDGLIKIGKITSGLDKLQVSGEIKNVKFEKFLDDTLSLNDLDTDINPKKILIVYYSRTGNTETIAKYIEEITGGDIYEIELVEPYPEDYNETISLAMKHIEEGYKPEIKANITNLDEYDTIFLGSPLWRGTISTPISSFLYSNDFSGKTIIPFITHGSSGISRSVDAVKELAPNSNISEGKAFKGEGVSKAKNEVEKWIDDLSL